MDNVGFIKTYEVTIVELDTKAETGMVVKAGEELSTGAFIIWCLLNDQEIVSTDDSYFVAFQHFRDKLLKAGYGIKCNGARLNVVPFSMIESSPKVHIVELGKSIRSDDYVNIWDKADINDFPDSREQNRFYDKWSRERKAIEERMERKAPIAIIILVLFRL